MNDEAAATAAEPHPGAEPSTTSVAEASNVESAEHDAEDQRRKITEKKAANLKDTIREFDVLIYAQLAAVYYMEYVAHIWSSTSLTPVTVHHSFVSSCGPSCNFCTSRRSRRSSLRRR